MKIYSGNAYGKDLEMYRKYDLGIMLASSSSQFGPDKTHKQFSCALDNGAFQCWQRGFRLWLTCSWPR